MGIFDKLFHRAPNNRKLAQTLNGFAPMFPQFGSDIYRSDVVVQAIKCIVDELKKLRPVHVRIKDNDPTPVTPSNIQDVLNNPNPLMTTSEFLEKMSWLLMMNYNAFVIPVYYTWKDKRTGEEQRRYQALYPINPSQVDFIEDASGRLFVTFWFYSGYNTTIPYENVIHVKCNYAVNQYMGGNELGQPDHKALLRTLELNNTLLEGVARAMKASYAVNAIVKYNTVIDDGTMQRNIEEMERKLQNNESGILGIDLKGDFSPLEKRVAIVDENTLKFVDEKILRHFGVPLPILTGDFSKAQYEAFYQKTLEPIIIAISQAFTKKIFTPRERSFGNEIKLYPKDLIFMSVAQTIEMVNLLSLTGALYENEKRVALGLAPLPELEGKRYMSLNWIDANNASAYQVGNKNVNIDVVDEQKEVV